ncbi:MAG: M23 family metallopeptidase [Cytophagaceae bacterium]|jgi:murein DD-endopeptidase MepM/ murein hydrolase activator NlpD|nr:M23 family metallopeptidase [Cytophagaceae bacterium]
MKHIYTCLIPFLILNNITAQKKLDWDIVPPLKMKAVVTGSFGELRANHFHTGIDFGTQQTTGHPVYAIDAGSVSRVFVSPTGYGKAVYIDHDNGYTSVYCHLDGFAPVLQQLVTEMQYARESFAIDHYFKRGEVVFRKGDVVGRSGNSGSSGGPHLHFEIRETREQKPVNAHFLNIALNDSVAPHVEAICIYPLDDDGMVNGKATPLYLPVVLVNGTYQPKGNMAITASGSVGIGVETLDYYTDSWRKCGIYSVSLSANGELVFESRLDVLSFDHQRYINTHIDYARMKTTGKRIQKSFVDKNNLLQFYTTNSRRGAVAMVAGKTYDFRYNIVDPQGNRSVVTFKIAGQAKTGFLPPFRPAVADASEPYMVATDGFQASFPANSFYTDVPALFSVEPNTGVGIGSHFRVLDETIPIHRNCEIIIPITDAHRSQKGLCGARVVNGKIVYAGGKRSGNTMALQSREGGVYTLAADTVAPTVRLLNVPQGRNYSNRKEIRIEIKDNFSGIKNYHCLIDGAWQLFEYDAKNSVIIGFFDKMRIQKGIRHELKVTVTDNAGNKGYLKLHIVY